MTEPSKNIVGLFEKRNKNGIVITDEKRNTREIAIPRKKINGAVSGQKVTVNIIRKAHGTNPPEGEITGIIGFKDQPGVDVLSIIRRYGVDIDFTARAMKDAGHAPDKVLPGDLEGRRDLRDELIITIDGEDAKDLDDAVSLVSLENGNMLLGVHIADVSHYVREDSHLDKYARYRGNSIYLIDMVIPMLPPKLSNGICSLNPNVDRLTLSCELEINPNGETISHKIFTAVINSKKRMTYTVVNDLLTNPDSVYTEDNADVLPMLKGMKQLCIALREKRRRRGAIEFSFTETKIILNKDGEPIDVMAAERNIATDMIEEFMVACNEAVAEEFYNRRLPFVYRMHEKPDSESMMLLKQFVHNLGFSMRGDDSMAIQKLLDDSRGKPEEMIISRVALRSLKQARYSAVNDGHFGLAARYYCHFTSPIRRYPDLQIHKIIKASLSSGLNDEKIDKLNRKLPEICDHTSKMERIADELERDVYDLKKIQYMAEKIGEIYDGIISGVTGKGIYVQLPNTVEGFVHVEWMDWDFFNYDETNKLLIGERSGVTYRLGDRITIRVKNASADERRLDFSIYNKERKKR